MKQEDPEKVQGQPGLDSEFQASQGYIETLSPKKLNRNNNIKPTLQKNLNKCRAIFP